MVAKFTALGIDKVRAGAKRLELAEPGGLTLITQPTGRKSWAVRYRINGTSRKLTLGPYPNLTLADARKLARQAQVDIAAGRDPCADKRKREIADGDTLAKVAEQFVQRHVTKLRPSSASQTMGFLTREILPRLGNKRINDISKRDVLDLLDAIVDDGRPVSANRTLATLRRLFNWSIERGIIERSPMVGIKTPVPETSRDRVLTDVEVNHLWQACEQIGYPYGPMVHLLLLTGARRTEVAGMKWSEIDMEKREWNLPAERTKNGEAHTVPLSGVALDILRSVPRIVGSNGYVLATGQHYARSYGQAKSDIDALMPECPRWTFHDLRRTLVSGMARLGVPLHVIEKVVNHTSGSFAGIVGVYQRHGFADEKREALERWAQHVVSR
jgi:integrase